MVKESKGIQRQKHVDLVQHTLLDLLLQRAQIRGDTQAFLAKQLGVSYERLTQWRRNEADIANARKSVHQAAGRYLGVPTIIVLGLCRKFEMADFLMPNGEPIKERIDAEISRITKHNLIGGFVPRELSEAKDAVKMLVVFLVHQLEARSESQSHWLTVMQGIADKNYVSNPGFDKVKEGFGKPFV